MQAISGARAARELGLLGRSGSADAVTTYEIIVYRSLLARILHVIENLQAKTESREGTRTLLRSGDVF